MIEIGGVLFDPMHVRAIRPGITGCSVLMDTGDWLSVDAPFTKVRDKIMEVRCGGPDA